MSIRVHPWLLYWSVRSPLPSRGGEGEDSSSTVLGRVMRGHCSEVRARNITSSYTGHTPNRMQYQNIFVYSARMRRAVRSLDHSFR